MSHDNHNGNHDHHNHSEDHSSDHSPDHAHSAEELAAKKALRPQIQRDNKYWLSLEQYHQDPEFLKQAEAEFQSSPLKEDDDKDGFARRDFLKLMGASIALASTGCIRRPVQKIVPYVQQPEEVTLGIANYYTSTYFDGSEGLALLVKTREGRPLKIEGNPRFPLNKGGVSARSQASILSLYDPERLRAPRKNIFNEKRTNKDSINANWDDMDAKITEQLKKGGAAILTGALASPSTRSVVKEFCQAFNVRPVMWEALSHEEVRDGQKASYGDDVVPFYRFDKAKVIVTVDADFLGTWLAPTTFARQFADGRRNPETMSKLVAFDSNFSLTGANSDIRYKIKPSQQLTVVMGLLHELVVGQGKSSYGSNAGVKSLLGSYANAAQDLGMPADALKKVAADLWENRGQSLVVAGGLPTRTANARDLQVAVNMLNSVLENDGKTIEGKGGSPGLRGSTEELVKLVEDMKAGKVKTLIIHRANPIYAMPASLGFIEALRKVEMVISTSVYMDEIAHNSHYVIPDNHNLESWGDAEFANGIIALQQPTIRGMYDTRSFQLSLMTWAFMAKQGPKRLITYETFYDYLKNFWKEEYLAKHGKGQSFEDFWQKVLQEGYIGEVASGSSRAFKVDAFTAIKPPAAQTGFELVLYPTVQMGDGTETNISWLHELPDPVTKIVWDNYVSVSVATAEKMHLEEGDFVEIKVGDISMQLPSHIQPGLHDDVMAVAVGYGHTEGGKIASGIGKNAYELVTMSGGKAIYAGQTVTAKKTGQSYYLACTQGHNSMEGRQIVVEATQKDFAKNKGANIHRHKIWSIWPGHRYNGHKWAMGVDLNVCTGCSACMIACMSENNVPVVGKKYCLQGREMHWIRIDRYYTGTPDAPDTVFQPVMCQHCDNAPCETVCPVLATTHSDDGLNVMVYNRCVGTRYCSNNCPYKVRRFNWFNYTNKNDKPLHMALNPEVTVRSRGVMEKCSFCSHRIKDARIQAKVAGRELKDGDIKVACQSACPTSAITFGDMNDPESQVSKVFKNERAYALLEEWNAAPSVRYMSKIRNNDKETASQHGTAHKGEHS
jgi:MoCo/4Fe-4S cofactor protein with predicted Tat translocation signal